MAVAGPVVARTGFRGFLNTVTGGLLKIGPGPEEAAANAEATRREGDERIIRQATWSRAVSVLVANRKGGVGKTPTSLILGGVLTEYLSWRWVFFVNVPIAVLAVVGALKYVPESRDETARGFDVPGAVLVTGGLMSLVYGLVQVNEDDVSTFAKTAFFVVAAVLLVLLRATVLTALFSFRWRDRLRLAVYYLGARPVATLALLSVVVLP